MGVASSRELDEVELQGNQTLMQANSGVASRLAESRAATSRTSRSVFLIGVGLACYIARSVRPQPRLAARSRPAGSVLQPAGAARDARRHASPSSCLSNTRPTAQHPSVAAQHYRFLLSDPYPAALKPSGSMFRYSAARCARPTWSCLPTATTSKA
jgi:hypothetical protein